MAEYRNRDTGEVKTGGQVKKIHSNTSFSKVVDTFADLGWDIIGQVTKPTPSTNLKHVTRAGVEQVGGKWVQKWVESDIFSGPTQAADEAAYLQGLNDAKAAVIRTKRDKLLSDSDHSQLDDSPKDKVAWKSYRAELRALPSHANFPDLLPGDWPVEPT